MPQAAGRQGDHGDVGRVLRPPNPPAPKPPAPPAGLRATTASEAMAMGRRTRMPLAGPEVGHASPAASPEAPDSGAEGAGGRMSLAFMSVAPRKGVGAYSWRRASIGRREAARLAG